MQKQLVLSAIAQMFVLQAQGDYDSHGPSSKLYAQGPMWSTGPV